MGNNTTLALRVERCYCPYEMMSWTFVTFGMEQTHTHAGTHTHMMMMMNRIDHSGFMKNHKHVIFVSLLA